MEQRRKQRLDSLFKEVLAEIIRDKVKSPKVHPLTTVTHVDVSPELDVAFVYISILSDDPICQKETLAALKNAAGHIAFLAFKEISVFQFPKLEFRFDESIAKIARMESIFANLQKERQGKSEDGHAESSN